MPDRQLFITEHDVKEPNLLLRYLRKVGDTLVSYGQRIGKLEVKPAPPSMEDIQQSLQALGSHPLYLGNLKGEAGDPQPAKVTTYTSAPTGLVLQSLKDKQLISIGTTSTGENLYRVVGGNPHSLMNLSAPATVLSSTSQPSAFVYTSTGTAVTSTGSVTLSFANAAHNQGSVYSAGTPTRLSAPSAGIYLVGAETVFSGSTSGTFRRMNVQVSGLAIAEVLVPSAGSANPVTVASPPIIYSMTSADYVESVVSHDAAVSITVGSAGRSTFLSLHRLS
jgi:hypothetical protein